MCSRQNKISIIVPVYNNEEYLSKCLDSLINQVYENIEIILVDDGSTDGSSQICDLYKNKDNRIKVFHISNSGQSYARNLGLDNAEGDYIGFVDSDDGVDKEMYNILVNNLEDTNADISICGSSFVYNKTPIVNKKRNYLSKLVCSDEIPHQCIFNNKDGTAIGNKLYKKWIFDSIRFPINRKFEDFGMVCKIFSMTNKVIIDHRPMYYYRQRSNSTMYSVSINLAKDGYELFKCLRKLEYLNNNYDELARSYISLCRDIKARAIFKKVKRHERHKIFEILNKGIIEFCKKSEVSRKTYIKSINVLKRPWLYVPKRYFAESRSCLYVALKQIQAKLK